MQANFPFLLTKKVKVIPPYEGTKAYNYAKNLTLMQSAKKIKAIKPI